MSAADELLATLSVGFSDEAYIYVNDDRTIAVPDELKHIAVEHDHNIETVTIDCPRYWDGHDFSKMRVYVNYMRPDGYKDSYPVKNLRVSDEDDTRILFDWTISANVTQIKGNIAFLVYIEDPDANPCWHSRLNQQMVIDEGLTCKQQIEMAPDSIEEVLARTTASYIAEAKAEIEGKTALSLASIPEDYTTVNNMAEEALREKSNAIKMEAEGEVITVSDSADNALLGLKIFGKTTQITTTGYQLIDSAAVSGVAAGVSFSVNNDRSVYAKGLATAAAYLLLEGGYAASAVPIPNRFVVGQTYTINDASLFLYSKSGGTTSFTNQTFVMPDGYDYYGIFIRINADTSVDKVYYPIMNIGSSALKYEPYSGGKMSPRPNWPQEIISVENPTARVYGKNLIPYPYTQTSSTAFGVTFTAQEDGGIHGTGTATDAAGIVVYSGSMLARHGVFTISITGTYKNMTQQITLYDANSKELITRQGEATVTIDLDNYPAADTMRILVKRLGNSEVSGVVYPQMEAGSTVTEYEKGSTVQSIELAYTTRGIPVSSGGNYTDSDGQQWICDEIDFKRGVYVQRVADFDLASIGNWIHQEGWENELALYSPISPKHIYNTYFDVADMFCNRLEILSPNSISVGASHSVGLGGNGGSVYVAVDGITTSADLIQYFTDNPTNICYPIAAPIETPLTDAELANFKMVRSNYPNTAVLNDSGAHMTIEYAGDTKTYVERLNGIDAGLSPSNGDNSAALHEAITKATAEGTTVHIPAGTYVFKTPIALPDGVTVEIVGASDAFANSMNREQVGTEYHAKANGTTLIYRGEGAMFRHQSCVFKFKDLSLVSQAASKNYLYTARLVGQTTVNSSTKGKIYAENCLFAGWKTVAGDPFVTDDLETALGGTLTKPETLEQCCMVASRCRFSFCGSAINMGVDSRLEDCAINKCYYGATFYGAAGFSTLANCRIEWCTYDGVFANQAHDVMITGCEFDRCGYAAVRYQACTGSSIIGNTMRRSGSDSSLTANAATKNTHLYVYGCSGGVIANNITVKKNIMDDGSSTVVRPVNAYNFQNCDSVVIMANDFNGCTTGTYNRYTTNTECRVLGNLGLNDET